MPTNAKEPSPHDRTSSSGILADIGTAAGIAILIAVGLACLVLLGSLVGHLAGL
jgi:hypothetical protein